MPTQELHKVLELLASHIDNPMPRINYLKAHGLSVGWSYADQVRALANHALNLLHSQPEPAPQWGDSTKTRGG